MPFEIGARVIMTRHPDDSYDACNIPIGSEGTVVEEQEEDNHNGWIYAVNWDTPIEGQAGRTYPREFYDPNEDMYIAYPNVWFVEDCSLTEAQGVSVNTRIINKIKILEQKVKNKTLRLRKVKTISFPDKRVLV